MPDRSYTPRIKLAQMTVLGGHPNGYFGKGASACVGSAPLPPQNAI